MGSRVVLNLVGVGALTVALACSGGSESGADRPGTTGTLDRTAPASEVGEVGTGVELTVAGPVTRVVDAHLFVIGAEGSDPVVVLTPRPGAGVRTGAMVEVTGALRRLTIAAVEAEFRIDLDDLGAKDLEGRPALVATRLRTSG